MRARPVTAFALTRYAHPQPVPRSLAGDPHLAWAHESHVMMGKNTYDVKDYVKTHFDNVEYSDLLFPGPHGPKSIIKTAWVVPIASQTASTGTLADLLRTLGATVTEVDLDAEDGDSDEEDERDGNALVDDEAEEEEEEE